MAFCALPLRLPGQFGLRVCFGPTRFATGIGAKLHLFPVGSPFFAPGKRTLAGDADLDGEVVGIAKTAGDWVGPGHVECGRFMGAYLRCPGLLQQGFQIRQPVLRCEGFGFCGQGIALFQPHFLDEARHLAGHALAYALALLAPGDGQAALRAGDAYIHEPALFFDPLGVGVGRGIGKIGRAHV